MLRIIIKQLLVKIQCLVGLVTVVVVVSGAGVTAVSPVVTPV